jgi:uncharacterized delta-60 repeat protein
MMFTCARHFILLVFVFAAMGAGLTHATPGQPGTLDPSWAAASALGAGKVSTPIGAFAQASAVAVQPDGKVVLAGACLQDLKFNFCALRYLVDGTLDTSFAGGSVVTSVLPGAGAGSDLVNAVALQPDGKIVLAGGCYDGSVNSFCAVRYRADGTLDTDFAVNGKLVTQMSVALGAESVVQSVAVLPDGRVLLGGTCSGFPVSFFCVARYLENGTLDAASGFGAGGKVLIAMGTTSPATTARAAAMAVQPDGKILLAGHCGGATGGSSNDFCVLRLLSTGALDSSWAAASAFGPGKVKTAIGAGDDQATSLALQPDGKVVLTGKCSNGTNFDFCALRYLSDGTVDASFGSSGVVISPIGVGIDVASASALQPDGKLLVAGSCKAGVVTKFCMLRYSANGSLDTSFGNGGTLTTAITVGNDFANAMSLNYDGKIVLVGDCDTGSGAKFCAARYDGELFSARNCSLDLDGDGTVLGTTDSVLHARIALGLRGAAVVGGISFANAATRTSWPLIRDYLIARCGMTLPQ